MRAHGRRNRPVWATQPQPHGTGAAERRRPHAATSRGHDARAGEAHPEVAADGGGAVPASGAKARTKTEPPRARAREDTGTYFLPSSDLVATPVATGAPVSDRKPRSHAAFGPDSLRFCKPKVVGRFPPVLSEHSAASRLVVLFGLASPGIRHESRHLPTASAVRTWPSDPPANGHFA